MKATALVMAVLLAVLPPPVARAAEVGPAPADTPALARLAAVMPPLRGVDPGPGPTWHLPARLRVDFGGLGAGDRLVLAGRLDLLTAARGRTWTEAGPPQTADLCFRAGPLPPEGYRLRVGSDLVEIEASGPAGRLYALVTLDQLLPARTRTADEAEAAPCLVSDAPAFEWRGLMIDVSRHFVPVETLEWVLELMARHKLNRFHWHLTDDQGWRLEIPGWPRLTAVGAERTEVDGRITRGYYTAADVARVVDYAARRSITVIPEIDLPGHASAALAAYPELSASGGAREVPLDWNVADGVLALGRASVDRFTADVLAELVRLFPGPWIHWGGDEVFRYPWMRNAESLAWMRRVGASTPAQALAAFWSDLARRTLAAGRTPVGWDDLMAGGAPPGTVLQWWDTSPRALAAVASGRSLIVSWKETYYLDYPAAEADGDRVWWMPLIRPATIAQGPLRPPGASDQQPSPVRGLEAALWTERAPQERLGRKLFPRLALVAERAWAGGEASPPGWEDRLADHVRRLSAWGVGMAETLR